MLHVIYRSYGGENLKGRPDFYSKRLALGSLVRAFQAIRMPAELIYLNDGPIPADRLQIMRATGEVIARFAMGNVGSIRAALDLPRERAWHRDDLVWFAEDDYLYRANALDSLDKAARMVENADYFGLYALIGNRMPNGDPPEDDRVPSHWTPGEAQFIDGVTWRKALSTTSTFGARVRTIAADRGMMRVAMRCGGAFDHSKCLAYQGFTPYPLGFLAQSVAAATGPIAVVRMLSVSVVRASFNVYAAVRRTTNPGRLLIASDPSLATHMEAAFLSTGVDWAAVAADTLRWLQVSGLEPPVPADSGGLSAPRSPSSPDQP